MPATAGAVALRSRPMNVRRRASVASAFALATALVAGACGTEEDANRRTPVQVQSTSYVTLEPETTTTTIAPADTTIPPEGAVSDREQLHTIVGGDSVWGIANRYGITPQELAEYNQWADGIDHFLTVGDTVAIPRGAKIPGTGSSDGGGESAAAPVDTDPPVACTHTIKPDENPSRVASKYGITFDILQQANRNHDLRNWFPIGEEVNIPAGATGC